LYILQFVINVRVASVSLRNTVRCYADLAYRKAYCNSLASIRPSVCLSIKKGVVRDMIHHPSYQQFLDPPLLSAILHSVIMPGPQLYGPRSTLQCTK